jgi:hypothetical protein
MVKPRTAPSALARPVKRQFRGNRLQRSPDGGRYLGRHLELTGAEKDEIRKDDE